MRHFKTEGIILDKTDIFDADRSYLIFTRSMGKIRARGKGVRKPSSKLSGHLLLFSPTQLEIVQTGDNFLITAAHSLALDCENDYVGRAIQFIQSAEVIAESLSKLYVEEAAFPFVYDGLRYTIERLQAVGKSDLRWIIMAEFLEKCLVALGLKPVLERCVLSGEPITEQSDLVWSSHLGGVVLRGHYKSLDGVDDQIAIRSNRTIILLRQFAREDFMAEKIAVSEEVQKEALLIIMNFIQTQIGRPIRSYQIGYDLL